MKKKLVKKMGAIMLVMAMICTMAVGYMPKANAASTLKVITNEVELQDALSGSETDLELVIQNDIAITDTIIIPAGKTVKIHSQSGENNSIKRESGNLAAMINVDTTANLETSNITFDGDLEATNTYEIMNIKNDAQVTLKSGSEFVNNRNYAGGDGHASGTIVNDGTLDVSGATISNNYVGDYGGAIYNSGVLVINEGAFMSNEAKDHGGAFYNIPSGRLTINSGTFEGNYAGGEGYHAGGGVLQNYGVFNIYGGLFKNNSALAYGGSIVDLSAAGEVTIENATFDGNRALNYSCGEFLFEHVEKLTLKNLIIKNTIAHNGSPVGWMTGADINTSTLLMENVQVADTKIGSANPDGSWNWSNFTGNAMIENFKTADVVDCTFTNNDTYNGCGIYISGGDVVNILGNTKFIANGLNYGGAGTALFLNSADTTVNIKDNVIFKGNAPSDPAGINGGAVGNWAGTINILGNVIFEENSTTNTGGAIYNKDKLNILGNVKFINNKATYAGGAIYNRQGTLNLTDDVKFVDNETTAKAYDSAFLGSKLGLGGGALYIVEDDPSNDISGNVAFENNKTPNHGGAIGWHAFEALQRLTVGSDVTFKGNVASAITQLRDQDKALYDSTIAATKFSYGLKYGYNNADIKYNFGPDSLSYIVNFETNGGSAIEPELVAKGAKITKPADPRKVGNVFKGWFVDEGLTDEFTFDTPITSNTTLYAKWETAKYTVKFVDFDGKELSSSQVEYGKAATAPANPKRDGYEFTGWDKDFSNITGDLTVTAKYKVLATDEINQDDPKDQTDITDKKDTDTNKEKDITKDTKKSEKSANKETVETGDSTNLGVLIGVGSLSLLGAVLVFRKRKVRQK